MSTGSWSLPPTRRPRQACDAPKRPSREGSDRMRFAETAWWQAFREELAADTEFETAARYFPARVQIVHDGGSATLDLRDGRPVSLVEGPHPMGADITLAAPDREWQRVIEGETD